MNKKMFSMYFSFFFDFFCKGKRHTYTWKGDTYKEYSWAFIVVSYYGTCTGSRGVQFELDNKESLTSLMAVIC